MQELLAKHYAPPPSKPPGGRIIKEIQAPQSTRQADALYLPTTARKIEKAKSADMVRCPKCGGPHPFHDPACVVHPDLIQDHNEQEQPNG